MNPPTGLAHTPAPPYYAVIFTSLRTAGDQGYAAMAARMDELGAGYDGYLGIDSVRGADGKGITVSYWRDEASILAWKRDAEQVRIAKVERVYGKQ
jgi:heme-degrading monooxygenase HmoA